MSTTLQAIQDLSDFIMRYAVTLAALGALTVGIQEAWKKLASSLPRFHQKAVRRWLDQGAPPPQAGAQITATLSSGQHYGVATASRAGGASYDSQRAYEQLLHLCTGVQPGAELHRTNQGGPLARNVSWALFELELSRMMSLMQDAADAALNAPRQHPDWFAFVTRGCMTEDIERWRKGLEQPPVGSADERARLAETFSRMRLLSKRQLDAFQTVTSYRWREWNQFWAWALGAALMACALMVKGGASGLEVVLMSLAGGLLAPVAKDLVDALARVKTQG